MKPIFLLVLLFSAHGVAAEPDDLGNGAERFAGAPVQMDVRLAKRTCLPGGFRFGWEGQLVDARCPATGERLLLPLARAAEAGHLKRGDSVQADYIGNGFRLSVGAVAHSSGQDGRLTLRNSRSGQQFGARLDQSGRIIVPGTTD